MCESSFSGYLNLKLWDACEKGSLILGATSVERGVLGMKNFIMNSLNRMLESVPYFYMELYEFICLGMKTCCFGIGVRIVFFSRKPTLNYWLFLFRDLMARITLTKILIVFIRNLN